ncbi:hypothetical protein KIK84_01180 [Curvibacter sp. CHRR-16]|uniref:hypothetical protein n=1 Tax=Curvibacter sp. CHRR-16 TaxID=2835872 RepID=UPI001BDA820A|nr:hypothetical protein [Curvibacter sp. CHRR-16]MBT0568926.1 hypothetical protein [Curvibacter sp. CHRR-16]
MSKALKFLIFLFVVLFLATGALLVVIVNADDNPAPWIAMLVRNHVIVFVWHLACWMLLGMFANYYWDLFNMGLGLEYMQVGRIVLPLLVSPIVFYPVYTLWLASTSQSYVLFDVIAFQSGFFWQALFTKAKPLEVNNPNNIPWSVNNGRGR